MPVARCPDRSHTSPNGFGSIGEIGCHFDGANAGGALKVLLNGGNRNDPAVGVMQMTTHLFRIDPVRLQ
jgi:hypothetical protein